MTGFSAEEVADLLMLNVEEVVLPVDEYGDVHEAYRIRVWACGSYLQGFDMSGLRVLLVSYLEGLLEQQKEENPRPFQRDGIRREWSIKGNLFIVPEGWAVAGDSELCQEGMAFSHSFYGNQWPTPYANVKPEDGTVLQCRREHMPQGGVIIAPVGMHPKYRDDDDQGSKGSQE